MRKLLLTTAMILPLGLGAALAQTPPPADAPMANETTPMGTDPAAQPMGTEPAADPMAEDAAEGEAAAMEAEMAASDMVVQQQAENELRLDWITDAAVTSPDGNAIGDINDLIVDGENGTMIAAIIGVGGFLGIGEKQIAVPFDQLSINYDAQEITSQLTQEEAEAAPEYVFREREEAPDAAGTAMPADGTAAPADGTTMPADGTMPADTMATTPSDNAAMPADGSAMPADSATMPAETAPAADSTMAPADGTAPADGAAMPEGTSGEAATTPPPAN